MFAVLSWSNSSSKVEENSVFSNVFGAVPGTLMMQRKHKTLYFAVFGLLFWGNQASKVKENTVFCSVWCAFLKQWNIKIWRKHCKHQCFLITVSCHLNVLRLHFHSFLWLHFWSFSRFVASCAFILAFCGSICFHVGFFCGCISILWFSPFVASFPFNFAFSPFILAFWAFISFRFCLLTLDSLSFAPSHPSFPFILAFSPFISFYFGLLGLHFLSFLPSHPSFWPFGLSFPFIFAFSPFISFHSGLLSLLFLSFWPLGSSCKHAKSSCLYCFWRNSLVKMC